MGGVTRYWGIVERSSDGFYTHFPDLPGANAMGDTVEASLAAAAEVAALHIQHMSEDGRRAPEAKPLERLPRDPDIDVYARSLVAVPVPGKAIRVNITIDEGLLLRIDREAASTNSNRSAFLADAARARLAAGAGSRAGKKARPKALGRKARSASPAGRSFPAKVRRSPRRARV